MNRLTIVMYHYVRRIKESLFPGIKGVELDDFIEQIEFLRKKYNIVTIEEVIDARYNDKSLPPKPALLTFDDGYAEHYSHVYPILRDLNLQGSFYIPAKTVLEHKLLDVNKIHFILASVDNIQDLVLSLSEYVSHYSADYNLLPFEEYFSAYAIDARFDSKEIIFVKRMLQHVLPEKLRNKITDLLFAKYVRKSEEVFAKDLYMDIYQIKELVRGGMHVGCHGYDHYWWNKLDHHELNVEIEKSMSFLRSIGCDMSNWTACYPYGSASDSVVAELSAHNCKLAFTTEVRLCSLTEHHLLLPRLDTNDFPPKSNNYKNYG